MTTLFILYLFGGLLMILLSIPLLLERIKPNGLYGFRVSQTLDDPRVWYAVNKYAAKRLMAVGIVTVLSATLLYLVPGISVDAYALACLFIFTIVFTVALIQSIRYLHMFTSQLPPDDSS